MCCQDAEYKKFGKAEPDKFATGKDGFKVGFGDTNCVYAAKGEALIQDIFDKDSFESKIFWESN